MAEKDIHEKLENLKKYLSSLGSAAIAFSGGVDSTFLLKIAHDILGSKAVAVTAGSSFFPKRETDEAAAFCKKEEITHYEFQSDALKIPGLAENPADRCYLCKRRLFQKMLEIAGENGITAVCEGSNMNDSSDYRPGLKAVEELGIKSPLRQCNLYKEEIRVLSREMGLPSWNKQSFACLATRFAYGEKITEQKLAMADKAEQLLIDMGFHQLRVRIHGTAARIEILPAEFTELLEHRERIIRNFKQYGFTYVTMDLQGYRTGSMNETLPDGESHPAAEEHL